MTTVLLEHAPQNPEITEAGRNALQAWAAELSRKLEDEGVDARRAERLASLTISALEGALVQARVERSGRPLAIAAEELERLFVASR